MNTHKTLTQNVNTQAHYLNSPMLSREEEESLWAEFSHIRASKKPHNKRRAEAIKTRIITSHLRMCHKVAKDLHIRFQLPQEDIFSAAIIGLIKAFNKFNPAEGTRFSTYASHWIQAESKIYVIDNISSVKTATTAFDKFLLFRYHAEKKRIKAKKPDATIDDINLRIVKNWITEQSQEPTPERIERHLERLRVLLKKLESRNISLDQPLGEDGEMTLIDGIYSNEPNPSEIFEEIQNSERNQAFWDVVEDFFEEKDRRREWVIFASRNLCEKEDITTLQDLSDEYGITRERVRQIEIKATHTVKRLAEQFKATANIEFSERKGEAPDPIIKPRGKPRKPKTPQGSLEAEL